MEIWTYCVESKSLLVSFPWNDLEIIFKAGNIRIHLTYICGKNITPEFNLQYLIFDKYDLNCLMALGTKEMSNKFERMSR